MRPRLPLEEIATHLRALLATTSFARIGTHLDVDFAASYGKSFNQVWLLGQRVRRRSSRSATEGYSGFFRAHMTAELAVRLVVRRNEPGVPNGEETLTQCLEDVLGALNGWRPQFADEPFVLVEQKDGPVGESITTVDLIFDCTITYS